MVDGQQFLPPSARPPMERIWSPCSHSMLLSHSPRRQLTQGPVSGGGDWLDVRWWISLGKAIMWGTSVLMTVALGIGAAMLRSILAHSL